MTSIKEIAALAGVSRGTVDRALNNRGGVNPQTAARIHKIAKDMGYKTCRAALALAASKRQLKIGAILPLDGNVFFEDVIVGLKAAEQDYADYGVTVSLKIMKGFCVPTQLRLMDELCAEGIQALIIAAINEEPIAQKINQLMEQGIPVITCNTDLENSKRLCYVGSDYENSGEIVGGLMGLVAGERPFKTVIYLGSVHVLGHTQRNVGFSRIVQERHSNIEILDAYETLDDCDKAYEITLEVLDKYPQLDAIYVIGAGIGGTCQALVDKNKAEKIKIFIHDCTSESRPYLENGTVTATIFQDPFMQGYQPVKILFDYLLDGQRPAKDLIHSKHDILIRESLA